MLKNDRNFTWIFENCIKIPDVNKFLEERGDRKCKTYVLEILEKDDKICSKGFAQAKQEKIHSEGENDMDYEKKITEILKKADKRRLRLVYYYVKGLFGLK